MAIYKLLLPKMGESVSEATLIKWVKQVGDQIEEDDAVVEIATDKVDSDVPSPVRGILKDRLFEENQVVQVGEPIALIQTDDHQALEIQGVDDELGATDDQSQVTETNFSLEDQAIPGIEEVEELRSEALEQERPSASGIRFYSPLVRNIAQQEGISQRELDQIPGTGGEGRVTKDDVLSYLQQGGENRVLDAEQHDSGAQASPAKIVATSRINDSGGEEEIVEMDRMRRLIADHMVQSVKTSPHVFSVVEADVTDLVNWRNRVKEEYKNKEGENITFTPLIIEAISKAIRDFPLINVSVEDYNIIRKKNINIGMATALPTGNLIVPVIKNVDQLSLTGISRSVNDLAKRSRAGKLKPDDTQGGTFTF
ncbi:MAG: dihydrolipoamide acetyltransferase family protein, partial [Sphingobacterium sp.]